MYFFTPDPILLNLNILCDLSKPWVISYTLQRTTLHIDHITPRKFYLGHPILVGYYNMRYAWKSHLVANIFDQISQFQPNFTISTLSTFMSATMSASMSVGHLVGHLVSHHVGHLFNYHEGLCQPC